MLTVKVLIRRATEDLVHVDVYTQTLQSDAIMSADIIKKKGDL